MKRKALFKRNKIMKKGYASIFTDVYYEASPTEISITTRMC